VAFNGAGGVEAHPTPQEEAYGREPHTAALAAQTEHEHAASQNRQMFASENHGRPAIAATARPGEFNGPHVERASSAGQEARPMNHEAGNRDNPKPSKQAKQAQKKAEKQSKAEHEEHR